VKLVLAIRRELARNDYVYDNSRTAMIEKREVAYAFTLPVALMLRTPWLDASNSMA